jgi:hypothetical protein
MVRQPSANALYITNRQPVACSLVGQPRVRKNHEQRYSFIMNRATDATQLDITFTTANNFISCVYDLPCSVALTGQ